MLAARHDDDDSLFNGLSTLVGYLMPKPSLLKNSSDTIRGIRDSFLPRSLLYTV